MAGLKDRVTGTLPPAAGPAALAGPSDPRVPAVQEGRTATTSPPQSPTSASCDLPAGSARCVHRRLRARQQRRAPAAPGGGDQ
jgi:hypothetical protein